MKLSFALLTTSLCLARTVAFQPPAATGKRHYATAIPPRAVAVDGEAKTNEAMTQKQKLLGLIGKQESIESVLADPDTKEPLRIAKSGVILGGAAGSQRTKFNLQSTSNTFQGTSDTYLDLLEPVLPSTSSTKSMNENSNASGNTFLTQAARRLVPLIPPPLRAPLSSAGFPIGEDYVPMRDLFTSPQVSFAYERGWRQGFASAGFPGPDKEAEMAMEYFAPPIAQAEGSNVVVDMSCATGLFTRRFTKSGKYDRVIGCDYSDSMLNEARRRIGADPSLSPSRRKTQLDLVRCDVGRIPMKTESIDAFHAGAAMHCWPELPLAASEIYRVLKPGGRYFATTFLSSYFGTLQAAEGGNSGPSQQAFQYFGSTDELRKLLEDGGFSPEKISIEVLQPAAVVIRCEK